MVQTAVSSGTVAGKLKLIEVTHVGGKRSFMLWGEVYKGWMWHMGHRKQTAWVRRRSQVCPATPPAPALTAVDAYTLGKVDGRYGLPDMGRFFAPFEDLYAQGYAVGSATVQNQTAATA